MRTRLMTYQKLTLMLLLLTMGCESANSMDEGVADSTEVEKSTQPEVIQSPSDSFDPMYRPVIVIMKNLPGGASSSVKFNPMHRSPNKTVKYGLSSGSELPQGGSKVTCQYLRTDQQGDHYRFERTFLHDQSTQKMVTKEVVYTGKELVIFQDEAQRISMQPAEDESE
ncbi:hypothetical protein [Gimesia maris]|uniref:hypothetical protein n=1 Tax=Gimesia maris TaxID=122 RepID=UPI0030D86FB2